MRTNYSNIRYHIYRELSKFQQKRTNDRSQLIDEITVPIFSGVISTSVAGILQKEVSNMLLFIPVMSLFFLVVLKMSKWVVCIYRNRIKPFFSPLKDQSQIAQNLEAESLAVSTAYTEILKKESKSELRNLRILDICFYVNNAIRKIQESLFSYPYPLSENNVSRNKIEAVMNVIYAIICEFKKMQDLPESYEAEIDDVQVKYDNTIESLNCMYELDLKQFS